MPYNFEELFPFFSRNSEENASEIQENLVETFLSPLLANSFHNTIIVGK